ncbi:putative reverse transcriptase domain-containing protein [Tanacetum coccineum]
MLKVSPWKGVVRFGKKRKLAPRFVGPFEILERIGSVAYRLRLPEELSGVHDTFHVSNLKKCLADANLHVPLDEIKVDKTLRFVEEPLEIMDHEVKTFKRSKIYFAKVRWNSKCGPEFTWECEDHMKAKFFARLIEEFGFALHQDSRAVGGRYNVKFWQTDAKALGTRLDMSTAYHPQIDGQSERTVQTLEDMLRACVINFGGSWNIHLLLAEFSYKNSYHSSIRCAPFEALYGRNYRSPVLHLLENSESYADNSRKHLEFQVGDHVMLKVSPWKGVVQFGKKGKLAPRFVGPFEILERIGSVAYRLRLPEELSGVHNTFHVSNLKKCLADANLHVPLDEIKVDKTLCFVEEPLEIMDREVNTLKRSKIPIVKVWWNSKRGPEFTWEREDHIKAKYP